MSAGIEELSPSVTGHLVRKGPKAVTGRRHEPREEGFQAVGSGRSPYW